MKYDLIISDYDGTFLNVDETFDSIEKFRKKGGKFVICTGRSLLSIKKVIGNRQYVGLVASFQGAVISDWNTDEIVYEGYIDTKEMLDMFDEMKNEAFSVGIYIDGYLHVENVDLYIEYYSKAVGIDCVKVNSMREYVKTNNKKGIKLICIVSADKSKYVINKYQEKYKKNFLINSSSAQLVECVGINNTKGLSVKRIAEYYNIPLSKVMTVGDSLNDVALLDGEWYGVAVGDADENLKKVAKEVTVDFKDNAIKHLLEKYCL